jgi:formylglycine-generating enzyme required for sulfatase activity
MDRDFSCEERSACLSDGGVDQICIPGGYFVRGSNSMEHSSHFASWGASVVYVSAFWIDRTEVTVRAYRECLAAGVCDPPAERAREYFADRGHDDYPMTGFPSYDTMDAYCSFRGGRLPTEAEWERAARGDDGRPYPWGWEADCTRANWAGCCGTDDPLPVGSFPAGASPYGVLDMIGNVGEVTSDAFDHQPYYAYEPPLPDCDPARLPAVPIGLRAARGCSAAEAPDAFTRCTAFYRSPAADGLRCARSGS